jgi:hypothetical protein
MSNAATDGDPLMPDMPKAAAHDAFVMGQNLSLPTADM